MVIYIGHQIYYVESTVVCPYFHLSICQSVHATISHRSVPLGIPLTRRDTMILHVTIIYNNNSNNTINNNSNKMSNNNSNKNNNNNNNNNNRK